MYEQCSVGNSEMQKQVLATSAAAHFKHFQARKSFKRIQIIERKDLARENS